MKILKRLFIGILVIIYVALLINFVIPIFLWVFFGFNQLDASMAHIEYLNDRWL